MTNTAPIASAAIKSKLVPLDKAWPATPDVDVGEKFGMDGGITEPCGALTSAYHCAPDVESPEMRFDRLLKSMI